MRIVQFSVKGVTYEGRQKTLSLLTGREPVRIVAEPENPFDSNALAVKVAYEGEILHIGYVPKERAADIAPELDGESVDGRIERITGGWTMRDGSQANFGIWVEFEFPDKSE